MRAVLPVGEDAEPPLLPFGQRGQGLVHPGQVRRPAVGEGERQQCESVSEEKLAGKLEKVRQRVAMDAANMTKPGADLIAWYLNPDRLPVSDRWPRKHAYTQRSLCQRFAVPVIGAVACFRTSEDVSRVDVPFVVRVGLGALVGGPQAGLGAWLGEQAGFGLGEDAAAGQALELGADALGVLGQDRQVQGQAQVAGPEGPLEVGEGGEDLLVGGVVRQVQRRLGGFCRELGRPRRRGR